MIAIVTMATGVANFGSSNILCQLSNFSFQSLLYFFQIKGNNKIIYCKAVCQNKAKLKKYDLEGQGHSLTKVQFS